MKIKWNIRMMMVKNNIHSGAELKRQLETVGVNLSSAQVTRIVNEMPSRINTKLLLGLINIFRCTTNDLLSVEHEDGDGESISNVRPLHIKEGSKKTEPKKNARQINTTMKKDREQRHLEDISALTGGPARCYPVKREDKLPV